MSKNLFNSNTFNNKNINNSNDVGDITITDATITDATIETLTNAELQAATSDIDIIQETVTSTGQVVASSNNSPQLLVEYENLTGGDALINIVGKRTGNNKNTSQLYFMNYNHLQGTTATFGGIRGRKVGGTDTNEGDLIFDNGNGLEMIRLTNDYYVNITPPVTTNKLTCRDLISQDASTDTSIDNILSQVYTTTNGYTAFDQNIELGRSSTQYGVYRQYYMGLLGNDSTGSTNVFCIAAENSDGGDNPHPVFAINQSGVAEFADSVTARSFVDPTGDLRTAINSKQDTLTIDTVLSTSSTNPVQNKIITAAINDKQDTLTIDTAVNQTSTHLVENQAVYTAISDLQQAVGSALDAKQARFQVGGTTRLSIDTTSTPNVLSVDTTNLVELGDNSLVLGGGIFTYLLNNYNKKLTIKSTSTNQLEITSTSTQQYNININDILSVKLATQASQSDLGLVTGQLLDTEIGNINFPTYTAESGGGIAVNSSNEISLNYNNMSDPNTIPRTTVISNSSTPQLTVTQPSSSRDAIVVIEGKKTSNLGTPAQLRFQNINSNTGDSRHYFRIAGVETDNINGIGGAAFYNFPLGTDAGKVAALTMSNNGNFNMGNGLVFQDDYKLKINGVLDVINIATINEVNKKIVMGVTNALGAATTSNSYCYMQMKSVNISFGVKDGGTFKINHGVDPDTGAAGSPVLTTSETDTTISNNLNVGGTSRIDNISSNSSDIVIGRTNQTGSATASNSYSWAEFKTSKLALAGPYVELRHSSTTSSTGTIGIEVKSTATTIKNNLIADGSATIDDELTAKSLITSGTNSISGTGNTGTSLNIANGCALFQGGTGNGLTTKNGVLQIRSRQASKLQDGASFHPSNNGNNVINFCNENGSTRGRVDGTGGSSISYRTSSDRRLKENVVDMNSCWDLIKELKPKNYNWIEDKRNDVGFIAQEVYALDGFKTMKPVKDPTDPEKNKYYCCDETNMCFDEDGYCEEPVMEDGGIYPHALDYGNFTPYLWKALQEAIARIEQLETKIVEIERRD